MTGVSADDGPPYECPECGQRFLDYMAANGHMVAHADDARAD